MAKQNTKTKTMPQMQITILEQTKKKGEKMTAPNKETHGIGIKSMDILQESKEKILRIRTGYAVLFPKL
jgi:hypothetical protein